MRYREFLAAMRKAQKEAAQHGVQLCLIGGMAVSVWGTPRATNDVDFLIWHPDRTGLDRFFRSLRETYPESEYFSTTEGMIARSLRVVYPGGLHVDWIEPRYGWQVEMLQRATFIQIGRMALPVIDIVDLIAMKLKAGGVKDDADASNLFQIIRGQPAMVKRLQGVARHLRVDRKLTRLIAARR